MSDRMPLVILAVIVVIGGWIRLDDLGSAPFFGDELDHYYAAASINEGLGPVLPSGEVYSRGREFTSMIALTLRGVDEREVAARLPSALFGVLGLILFALVARRLGGPWVAVWGTLLLAIYPEAIIQSRQSRFYTYQMAWGIIAMYAGWRAIQPVQLNLEDREPVRRTWMWATLALVAFAAATRVQVTTLSVLAAWGLAVLVAAGLDWRRLGRSAWRHSPAVGLAAAGAVGLVIGSIIEFQRGTPILETATTVPSWAGGRPGDARTYLWAIGDAFPLLIPLLPVVFLVVGFRRSPMLAVFLTLWFALPLALHSFVLPWKGERYIFMAMPALFLASGFAAAAACELLWDAVSVRVAAAAKGVGRRTWWAPGAVALASVFAVAGTPAARRALQAPPDEKDFRWRVAARLIGELPGSDTLALGSSMGLPALFYLGRVDFVVGVDFLPGSDWYSGAPVLTTPDAIWAHTADSRKVIIAVDGHRWTYGNVDPRLRDALSRDGVELCDGLCGDLRVYVWEREPLERGVEPTPLEESGE